MATKAKESRQILKARKKLKNQIAEESKFINANSLEKIRKTIHYWLSRHSNERVNLKSKAITLFDENRHSAKPQNKFILSMLKNLKTGPSAKKTTKTLTGRIKTH